MNFVYVLIAVSIISGALWMFFSKKRDRERAVSYECPNCGERHCDCYRKGEAGPPDSD